MKTETEKKERTIVEILEQLARPFSSTEIEWRVGAKNTEKTQGLALAYVTNRAIQNRLDEVFGVFGWKNTYREWHGQEGKYSQLCSLSVWDKEKQQWIGKEDGADNTEFESTKGGLSVAMKRAAYQWGIGRYLYDIEPEWMPIRKCGKSFVLSETPALPNEALPENERGKTKEPVKNKVIQKLLKEIRVKVETLGYLPDRVEDFIDKKSKCSVDVLRETVLTLDKELIERMTK